MTSIRMLHIGKTGGSALKTMLKSRAEEFKAKGLNVKGRTHDVTMKDLIMDGQENIIVFVRHPVSRFVSAFNSRLRQGQPRYFAAWTEAEEIAFSHYKEPNQLAEALSSDEPNTSIAAKLGMLSINHVRDPMGKWLGSIKFLNRNIRYLYFVGMQETMDEDVTDLFTKMGVTPPAKDLDEVARHETPAGFSKELSPQAVENLKEWYAKDVALYEWCVDNKANINAAT